MRRRRSKIHRQRVSEKEKQIERERESERERAICRILLDRQT